MRLTSIVVLSLISIAVVFLLVFGKSDIDSETVRNSGVHYQSAVPDNGPVASQRETSDSVNASINRPLSKVERTFSNATDLREFVDQHLELARGTDADAQYFIYKALIECQMFARAYTTSGVQTKDEWLVALAHKSVERRNEISEAYDKCESFIGLGDEELAEYYGSNQREQIDEWLLRSAEGGHPVAQVIYAAQEIHSSTLDSDARAIELLEDAAISQDPEALKYISWYFAGGEITEQAAWAIVACEKGYDCGPDSDITNQLCTLPRSCMRAETTHDVLKANLGEWGYSEANRRAQEIAKALDSGDVGILRLESVVSLISD